MRKDNIVLPTAEEIDDEVRRVMNNFCHDYKAKFMRHGETPYQLAKRNGKDSSTFKEMIDRPHNCEVKSAVQVLYPFGYTVEIKIVPRKPVNGKTKLKTVS